MPFQRLGDFSGRSRRTEFWTFWLAAMIVQTIMGYVDAVTSQPPIVAGMGVFTLVTTLILMVPAATVGVRRLHDIDWPGWWMLLFGLPYFVWLASLNEGPQNVLAAVALLLGSVVLLVLLVQPSTVGENIYGPNPKGGIAGSKSAD